VVNVSGLPIAPKSLDTPNWLLGVQLFTITLAVTLAASTAVLSTTWRLFYSFSTVEWIEKALVPMAFVISISLTLFLSRFVNQRPDFKLSWLALISLPVILIELVTQGQPTPTAFDYRPLNSFTFFLALLIGFLVFAFVKVLVTSERLNKTSLAISLLLLGVVGIWFLARLLGLFGWNFEHADAVPIFEELYAVGAGRDPYVDFAPLYQALLSYPYRFFISTGLEPVETALWYVLVLQFLSLGLVAFLLFRLVQPKLLWISAVIFLSMFFASPFVELSIGDFWSNFPMRYFWPLLTAVLILLGITQRSLVRRAFFLGLSLVSATSASISNFEFGIPVLLATVLIIVVFQLRARDHRVWWLLVTVPPGIWALFLGVFALRGRAVDFDLYYGYAFGYQGIEWMAIHMPTRGFHLVYLGIPAAVLAWAVFLWLKDRYEPTKPLILGFFALVALASFVYFAGRSALTGTISLNFYLALMLSIWVPSVWTKLCENWQGLSVTQRVSGAFLPALTVGVAFLALFTSVPSRQIQIPNYESFQRWYWIGTPEDVARAITASAEVLTGNLREVAVVIPNSSYAARLAGVSDSMLTPQPFHISEIPVMAQKQCELWSAAGVRYVLGEKPPSCAKPIALTTSTSLRAFAIDP
jgi:hypothetical protein